MKKNKMTVVFFVMVFMLVTLPMFAQQAEGKIFSSGEKLIVSIENMDANTWYAIYRHDNNENWVLTEYFITGTKGSKQFSVEDVESAEYYLFVYEIGDFDPTNPSLDPTKNGVIEGVKLLKN